VVFFLREGLLVYRKVLSVDVHLIALSMMVLVRILLLRCWTSIAAALRRSKMAAGCRCRRRRHSCLQLVQHIRFFM